MTETALTISQISSLSSVLTGEPAKRAATKGDAIKRFLSVAETAGVQNVTDLLAMPFEIAKPTVEQIKTAIDAAADLKTANAPKDEAEALPEPRTMSEPMKSPGLARLRASKEAEAIRLATVAASDTATAVKGGTYAERRLAAGATPETSEGETGFWQQTENGPVWHTLGKVAKAPKAKAEKVAKPAKVKKEKAAKVAKAPGSNVKIGLDAVISAVVANPKGKGSRSFARFELYRNGATVGEYIDACVAAGFTAKDAKADLSWDRRKGFITIVGGAA